MTTSREEKTARRERRQNGPKNKQWTVTMFQLLLGLFIVGIVAVHHLFGLLADDSTLLWIARVSAILSILWFVGYRMLGLIFRWKPYSGNPRVLAVIIFLLEVASAGIGVWVLLVAFGAMGQPAPWYEQ